VYESLSFAVERLNSRTAMTFRGTLFASLDEHRR
jgi:hypothetical protein